MACTDVDGYFQTINVGDFGRNRDGGVFQSSRLGCWLQRGGLHLRQAKPLPYDDIGLKMLDFFRCDEAFPMKLYITRPYHKF